MAHAAKHETGLLSGAVQAALERLEDRDALIERTLAWSAINSGSHELAGLERMRDALTDCVAMAPGEVERIPLAPTQRISARGQAQAVEHGEAIRVRVRPEAPIQIALTGHYDTVFPAAHPFQTAWREDDACTDPATADMKGGISSCSPRSKRSKRCRGASASATKSCSAPDEEVGSPGSAPLLAELGARAHLGMTYEPALADGALVDARKGSGNFSLALNGRAAHVGRAFDDGRSAVAAAAEAALALDALNGEARGRHVQCRRHRRRQRRQCRARPRRAALQRARSRCRKRRLGREREARRSPERWRARRHRPRTCTAASPVRPSR